MVDQKYKYGFVVAKQSGGSVSFPTIPAGQFNIHHVIVGDWLFVICGVAIYQEDFSTWMTYADDINFFYLGPNLPSARQRLNNVWSKLIGDVYVEWDGTPGSSNFKRFGMFCGCDL